MSSPIARILSFPDHESDFPPLIPEGKYQLKLLSHSTSIMFGKSSRLVLEFSVVDFGEHHGTRLIRYYNVEKLKSKPGKNGQCKHKRRGDFMIEYFTLFPGLRATRLDRVSMEPLYQSVLVGMVRNVTKNTQQKDLPAQLHYSVVGKLVGVAE